MIQLGIFLPPGGVEPLLEQLRQGAPEIATMLDDLAGQGVDTRQLANLLIGGVTGLVVLLVSVGCLALARGWQAGSIIPAASARNSMPCGWRLVSCWCCSGSAWLA